MASDGEVAMASKALDDKKKGPITRAPANFRDLGRIMDQNVMRASFASPSVRTRPTAVVVSSKQEAVAEKENAACSIEAVQAIVPTFVPAVPREVAGAASISLALSSAMSQLLAPAAVKAATSVQTKGKLPTQAAPVPAPTKVFKEARSYGPTTMSSASIQLQPVEGLGAAAKPLLVAKTANMSAFPDLQMLRDSGKGYNAPSAIIGARKAALVWFRNDLRVHDNEPLMAAHSEAGAVLAVYCFDPRDYGKSSSGFDKTGPYRAKFLLDCVSDLRKNLRDRGSDLIVRIGRPEEIIPQLAKKVGATAVYAHQEVMYEELQSEERVRAALNEEGIETKLFWGSTLYHMEDLPFKLEDMPPNYGGFREKVQSLRVRPTVAAMEKLKPVPKQGAVEAGNVPTLADLGISGTNSGRQTGSRTLSTSGRKDMRAVLDSGVMDNGGTVLVGGETEALQRLSSFVAEATSNRKPAPGENLYGANFSCKISPWLATGCLSPRKMYEDLKAKGGSVTASAAPAAADGSGLNWLVFELLWRDFFRFITKKFGDARRKDKAAAPASAQASVALASAAV